LTATAKASYTLIPLDEAARAAAQRGFGITTTPDPDGGRRGRVYLRRDHGINSFGVNAFFQEKSGADVVGEHDELGPGGSGHEELYIVAQGGCTFTVDGEEFDAPQGSTVFVPDPATKRSAVATADGTIVVAVGGRPGEPFKVSPSETMGSFFPLYRNKQYVEALDACRGALEAYPGNPLVLYNIACLECLLGNSEAALEALGESLPAWPDYRKLASEDDDLAALRDDPRFQELLAG
jgi:hypothetical protein